MIHVNRVGRHVVGDAPATGADQVDVEFNEGVYRVPSCYYEFAKRYNDSKGKLFSGFIAGSADKIFESISTREIIQEQNRVYHPGKESRYEDITIFPFILKEAPVLTLLAYSRQVRPHKAMGSLGYVYDGGTRHAVLHLCEHLTQYLRG